LAIRLTMLMLPYMPMVCVVALLGAMLQVRSRFGPAAFAPVLLNLAMIAAAALALLGGDAVDRHERIWFLATSVLIAGVAQLAWQFVPLLRTRPFAVGWAGCGAPLKKLTLLMLPMVFALAVFQINTLLDSLIAMGFSPKSGGPQRLQMFGLDRPFPIAHQGAVASLELAQRLYQFPLGVFGIALATAIFPALAHAAPSADNGGDDRAFGRILRHGLRLTVFIGLPATAGLVIVRLPLVRVLFEHGRVDLSQSIRTASILAGYASAVWAYSMTHVLTRAYYAVKNARTPLIVSVAMVALNLALNLTLIWPLGAAGLAWSTAISAVCQVVLLTVLLRRHVADPIDADVRRGWARSLVLTAIMAAALAPVTMFIDAGALTLAQAAGMLAAMVGGGVVIFVIGALILRSDELKWLIHRRID
jgi:putative peptidoglycan lipid II flippase